MISTTGKSFQQVLNEIAAKLIEQGVRCYSESDEQCLYGDGSGNHCAVGWLIPEGSEAMTSKHGVNGMLVEHYIHLGENRDFIMNNGYELRFVQALHDSATVSSIDDALERLGTKYNLEAWTPWIALRKSQLEAKEKQSQS